MAGHRLLGVLVTVLALTLVPASGAPATADEPGTAGIRPVSFVTAVRAHARREAILASVMGMRPAPPAVPAGIRVARLSAAVLPADAVPPAPAVRSPAVGRRDLRRLPSRGRQAGLVAAPLLWPAAGDLSSHFGLRWNAQHRGIDIAAPPGAPIFAARSGTVVLAGWYGGYGLTVILDHGGGLQTLYAHASALLVRPGQQVRTGQLIARVGDTGVSTGPHLHFEFRIHGRPVNPLRYL